MAVIGFNYNKISAERKPVVKGEIKISNNVSIKDVDIQHITLGKTKQETLKISFEFTSKYEPNFGEIKLEGDIMFAEDEKLVKQVSDNWKKDKKLSKEVLTDVMNNILGRCNIQAMIMSRDINLPPPLPLPKVQANVKAKE